MRWSLIAVLIFLLATPNFADVNAGQKTADVDASQKTADAINVVHDYLVKAKQYLETWQADNNAKNNDVIPHKLLDASHSFNPFTDIPRYSDTMNGIDTGIEEVRPIVKGSSIIAGLFLFTSMLFITALIYTIFSSIWNLFTSKRAHSQPFDVHEKLAVTSFLTPYAAFQGFMSLMFGVLIVMCALIVSRFGGALPSAVSLILAILELLETIYTKFLVLIEQLRTASKTFPKVQDFQDTINLVNELQGVLVEIVEKSQQTQSDLANMQNSTPSAPVAA